jgi:exonuclease III
MHTSTNSRALNYFACLARIERKQVSTAPPTIKRNRGRGAEACAPAANKAPTHASHQGILRRGPMVSPTLPTCTVQKSAHVAQTRPVTNARPKGITYAAYRGNGPAKPARGRASTEGMLPSARPARKPRQRRNNPVPRDDGKPMGKPRPTSIREGQTPKMHKTADFLVVSSNIDGITDDKLQTLLAYLKKYKVDIYHIQETQVANLPEWFARNSGYKIIHHPPRAGSKSGGCATLVKQRWECKQLPTLPHEGDVCWSVVDTGHEKIVSANVYWRSGTSLDTFTGEVTEVADRLKELQTRTQRTILCGDINTDARRCGALTLPQWGGACSIDDTRRIAVIDDQLRECSLHRTDTVGDLKDTPTHFPWQAAVRKWHIDALAIDERLRCRIVTSGIDDDTDNDLVVLSDHRPLWCKVSLRINPVPRHAAPMVFKVSKATPEQWAKSAQLLTKFANEWAPSARLRASQVNCHNKHKRQTLVNSLTKELNSALHRAYEKGIGTHRVQIDGSKFWNPALSTLKSKACKQARIDFAACKHGDVTTTTSARKTKSLRKNIKHTIRKLMRQRTAAVIKGAATSGCGQSKLWRHVSSLKPASAGGLGEYCTYKDIPYDGAKSVADALTKKMSDIHNYVPASDWYDQAFHDKVTSAMPELLKEESDCAANAPYTNEELEVVLKKLRGRETRQAGPDGMKYWMITKCGPELQAVLLWYYNLIWEWECIPNEWKHSNIRYLYKGKGSKFDLTKYRPISLISCVGKAFTMLWLPRMEAILRPLLAPEQAGFVPKSGALEALWTLNTVIDTEVSRPGKHHVYACFADTATAFDTVWRDGLYFILYSYGIRGKLLRLIKAWHDGATATGHWYTAESRRIQYSQGVRQGCVIAPLLYVCFVNPLVAKTHTLTGHSRPDLAREAFSGGLNPQDGLKVRAHAVNVALSALLYVDDVCILAPDAASLQRNLTVYEKYARKWRYNLNPGKFHVVPFGKARTGDETWSVTDEHEGHIEFASEATAEYLGAHLDKGRTGSAQAAKMVAKAKSQAPLLTRISHRLSEDVALMVKDVQVDASALYGAAASHLNNPSLLKLDTSITATCLSRAHLMPRGARKELSLFESETLWASSKITLSQARLAMKLKSDPHPLRQDLLSHVEGAHGPAKSKMMFDRVNGLLKSVGAPPLAPSKSRKPKRKKTMEKAKAFLLSQQACRLTSLLPLQPSRQGRGRGSASIFNALASSYDTPCAYNEASRLSLVTNAMHRKILKKIRTGQINCATEREKWCPGTSLACPCGAPVQDAQHLLLECPTTAQSRSALYDTVRTAADKDPALGRFLATSPNQDSVLLATLGSMIPGEPTPSEGRLSKALVALAAPKWAQYYEDHLDFGN